jgi:hypothetical protein
MDPSKAIRKAEALMLLSQEEKLPLDVTTLLERHQVFDEVLKKDRQKLPPEQRARLFVRSTKERHTPAMAASIGSLATALARASLLDAKDVVAVPAPDKAGNNPGGPSYSFRDNAHEWESARRCRTLMQTASSVDELQAGLEKVRLGKAALPCRDEAGRFNGQCTPEEIKRSSQKQYEIEQPRPDKSARKDEFSHLPLRSERKAARKNKARLNNLFTSDDELTSGSELG